MNPYPVYRPFGVEWFSDMPKHWEVQPARNLGRIRYGLGQPPRESSAGVPLIRATNVERGRIFEKDLIRVDPSDLPVGRDALLRAREIVVVRSGAYTADSAIIPTRYEGAVTGYDMVMTITGALPEFVAFALLAPYLRDAQLIVASTRSAQPHLNAEELGASLVLVPPLPEQAAIVKYLERETERIDALVAKMRLLIERLQEYRAALITRTVTRGLPPDAACAAGLDPSPRLKPSGVEWFGEVPEHWEVKRLEHVASYQTSSVDKKAEEGEIPVRLCNYTDVYYQDRIRVSQGNFMAATATRREIANFRLEPGDVVITKDSEDWQDIGIPALVDETADDFVCGYHLGVIRPRPVFHSSFLFRLMQSGAVNQRLQTAASGVTRYGLPNSAVTDVTLPLPPFDEQRTIAAFLDRETERIDALVAKNRQLIERLQEYRAALINAAVTGKFDVREPLAADGS